MANSSFAFLELSRIFFSLNIFNPQLVESADVEPMHMEADCIFFPRVLSVVLLFFHVTESLNKAKPSGICNWPFVCGGVPLLLCEFGG